ncbi:hypothetical protein QQF64_031492 [Cirrhinus molitorella]|uniref:Integrase catalytic domain-containing protein n=1 Tax=Cirrhinus molitorella TaxID=172907 RepID=A0ABR3MX31_9TELE
MSDDSESQGATAPKLVDTSREYGASMQQWQPLSEWSPSREYERQREHTSTLPEQSSVVLAEFQQLRKETEELRRHSYEQIRKLTERNEALETQLSLLAVSDQSSYRPQSPSSPVPQPRVHTPPVATDAKPIPLPRSKLPQRLSHSAAESFRQDRLQDLEQRLQQLEMISSPTHARPSLHQSFPQRTYDRVDDGRNGYRPTQLRVPPSQENQWPQSPLPLPPTENAELKQVTFCGLTVPVRNPALPDCNQFGSYKELLAATAKVLHETDTSTEVLTAEDYREAELALLHQAQSQSFLVEMTHLKSGKPLPMSSRLLCLAPEYDSTTHLIRVGGRLRRTEQLDESAIHPIVLDPKHPLSRLIIQDFDESLHHPGAERVFAEVRRKYWILRGREAIRQHQRMCLGCKQWRGQPSIPRMADLPPSRLRFLQPTFYSTGVDCFGPYLIKIGRRHEKRWGIIFKCLTTRAVYLDLLHHMDTDSFLMALRRFISRRGKPFEIISDQGTNFRGGERALQEDFAALHPSLQEQLAGLQISFKFNPPGASHFGGCWEREIRSLKSSLCSTLGDQIVTEEVLRTVLVEIEGILNSKPLGYTSSDVADPDPVTPNMLLMGRPDSSLPQVELACGPDVAHAICELRPRSGPVVADCCQPDSG